MAKQQNAEVSVVEAARRLNVEVKDAYALMRSGRFEACKSDRQWLNPERANEERSERLAEANSKWKGKGRPFPRTAR